eukprot:symbB.v1.2.010467.t1/scaffold679.1/size173156/3
MPLVEVGSLVWREHELDRQDEKLSRSHCRSVGKAMSQFKEGNYSGFCEALAVGGCQDAAISVTLAQPQEPDCPLIGVSKGFQTLSGYRRDEVLGRNCRFLNRGCAIRQEDRMKLRASARSGKSFSGLLQNRKKNGEVFLNLVCINSLRVGSTFYLLGIQVDMTNQGERRDVQEVVRAQLDTIVKTISEAQQDALSRLQVPFNVSWLQLEGKDPSSFVALETQSPAVLTKNTFLEVEEDEQEFLRRAVSESMLQGMAMDGSEARATRKILKDHAEWLDAFPGKVKPNKCIELPESVGVETPSILSIGSRLHPNECTPCSFYCYSLSGCNKAEACTFCHNEHLRRPKRRSKKKRDEKDKDEENE